MLTTITVYLIDDDLDDHTFFTMAIERMYRSIRCEFACNGLEAVHRLQSDRNFIPDFVFIDINMPLMNGVHCLKEILKIPRLNKAALYMYSTSADPLISSSCIALGATGVIKKMAGINDLKDTLLQVFQQQRV